MRCRKEKHGNPTKKDERRTKNDLQMEHHTGKIPETE